MGKSGNMSDLPGRGVLRVPPTGVQVLSPRGLELKHELVTGLHESDQGISPQGLLGKVLQTGRLRYRRKPSHRPVQEPRAGVREAGSLWASALDMQIRSALRASTLGLSSSTFPV